MYHGALTTECAKKCNSEGLPTSRAPNGRPSDTNYSGQSLLYLACNLCPCQGLCQHTSSLPVCDPASASSHANPRDKPERQKQDAGHTKRLHEDPSNAPDQVGHFMLTEPPPLLWLTFYPARPCRGGEKSTVTHRVGQKLGIQIAILLILLDGLSRCGVRCAG